MTSQHTQHLSTETAAGIVALMKPAMRRLPSGIALITAQDPETGKPVGLAASSVISVSMEPPSMLVSINRSASAWPVIERTNQFCINLLSRDHRNLVQTFSSATHRHARFSEGAWEVGPDGVPFLTDSLASLFCRTAVSQHFGTHAVCIGEVIDVRLGEGDEPLVWLNGTFAEARQI